MLQHIALEGVIEVHYVYRQHKRRLWLLRYCTEQNAAMIEDQLAFDGSVHVRCDVDLVLKYFKTLYTLGSRYFSTPYSLTPSLQAADSRTFLCPFVICLQPQRLTLGLVVAEWNGSSRRRTREVMKMGGTGCIVIKHDTRPLLGPALAVPVLDVDISLRQAEFAISADVCVGLHALSSTYLNSLERPAINALEDVPPVVADIPIQSLFCEEFWYLDDLPSAGESCSKELNFDTLSSLLEQVSCPFTFFFIPVDEKVIIWIAVVPWFSASDAKCFKLWSVLYIFKN